MNAETKTCQNCHQEFCIEPEDFNFYERIRVPAPTWCPECRMKRRMTFRSEHSLFKRKCDLCGKEIIAMYHPEAEVIVYCYDCWWSDKWDAADYGREYDFSKPFFEQFGRLLKEVPRAALEGYKNENCPYTNYTWFSKNIYLCPSTLYSENISYSHGVTHCQDSMDCVYIYNSQLCYESLDSQYCSSSKYLTDCRECIDCAFLYDCRGCNSCFMSSNLRNKSYVLRNQELSKGEYEEKMKGLRLNDYSAIKECIAEYDNLKSRAIHRFANLFRANNCSGNNLSNAKNTHNCFTGENLENVNYGIRIIDAKDSADLYGVGDGAELLYDGVNVGYRDSLIRFSMNTFENIIDATYCNDCRVSRYIFGCAGLRKKQYHILNKAYSKDEYEALVPKIIKHMNDMPYVDKKGRIYPFGEFSPSEFSPFSYNESIAQEYYPMAEKEAVEQGFRWRALSTREYKITKNPNDLPDDIKEVEDSITGETIGCLHGGSCDEPCTTAFKILESELQFYRRLNLPLPRLCPNCRHHRRIKYRNPLNIRLWRRACMCDKPNHGHTGKCHNEFETPYSPDRPETIYCEQCYQSEVV